MSAMAGKRARQAELRRLMQAEREQLQQEQTQTQAQATRQAAPLAGVLRKSKYGPLGQETGLSQLPSEEKRPCQFVGWRAFWVDTAIAIAIAIATAIAPNGATGVAMKPRGK